jgi:hypothetical protein
MTTITTGTPTPTPPTEVQKVENALLTFFKAHTPAAIGFILGFIVGFIIKGFL